MKQYTRTICAAASLAALFIFPTACSKRQAETEIVIIGEDSANLQAMEALKSGYERDHGIKIKFIRDPFDTALQKSNQDLASGTGQYDIICQYAASLAPYVNNNYVLTLDEMAKLVPPTEVSRAFEADLFPGVWRETGFFRKSGTKEVIRAAYPFAATTMLLVYNKQLFSDPNNVRDFKTKFGRELAVPQTWEDYKQIAEFFTNPARDTFGVVMEGAPGGFLYWEWCNYAYGMNGGVMKKEAGWGG